LCLTNSNPDCYTDPYRNPDCYRHANAYSNCNAIGYAYTNVNAKGDPTATSKSTPASNTTPKELEVNKEVSPQADGRFRSTGEQ
jgi:hypothetical protein